MNFRKLLMFTALLTTVHANGQKAASFTIDNVSYTTAANGNWRAYVAGADPSVTNLVIPDNVTYDGYTYPVTLVSANAFQNNTNLQSVSFGKNVLTTGNYAFAGCTGLKHLVLGEGMTSTGQYAFKDCTGLDSVTVNAKMTQFYYGAFQGCTNLQKVKFLGTLNQWAGIKSQNYNADANPLGKAHNLYVADTLVTTLHGLTASTIEAYAFAGATCLEGKLDVPAELNTIDQNAFQGCTNISGVNFLGTIDQWMQRELGGSLLSYSGGELYIQGVLLESLTIPETVTSIANYAFQGITSLKGEIVIPESVNTIGYSAFAACPNITSVTIGNGVTKLGSSCFQKSTGLTQVTIGNKVSKIDIYTFNGCTALQNVTIGSAVTQIASYAFDGCSALSCELPLPEGLTTIDSYAFRNCGALTGELNIPESVTSIGSDAFNGCKGFTSLSLGSGVTTIGSQAFKGCSGMQGTLTIPENITSLGNYAFQECSGFTGLDFQSKITSIPTWCFASCSGLTGTLNVPEGVTQIETNAFSYCSSLTGLSLPSTLTFIGNNAFASCSGLSGTLTIPDKVTTINQYAFSRCTGIEAIQFGTGVRNLYTGAFYNCEGLNGIVTLPEAITSIPQSCFWQCYQLQGVVIGEKVTSIGKSAFDDCRAMKGELVIPNSVTTIGESAFSGCSQLSSLKLGSGLKTLGAYALSCDGLVSIVCDATEPPAAQSTTFSSVNKSIPLKVPEESASAYRTATGWQDFININPDRSKTYTLTYMLDGEEYDTQEYAYGETIVPVAEPSKIGYTFSGWNNLPETMPDEDVTVYGTMTANVYTLTIYIDGEIYTVLSFTYGQTIELPEITIENKVFDRWLTEIPQTMPAENIDVYGVTKEVVGIESFACPDSVFDVYDLAGNALLRSVTREEAKQRLQSGIYIFASQSKRYKIIIRN